MINFIKNYHPNLFKSLLFFQIHLLFHLLLRFFQIFCKSMNNYLDQLPFTNQINFPIEFRLSKNLYKYFSHINFQLFSLHFLQFKLTHFINSILNL